MSQTCGACFPLSCAVSAVPDAAALSVSAAALCKLLSWRFHGLDHHVIRRGRGHFGTWIVDNERDAEEVMSTVAQDAPVDVETHRRPRGADAAGCAQIGEAELVVHAEIWAGQWGKHIFGGKYCTDL